LILLLVGALPNYSYSQNCFIGRVDFAACGGAS